MIVVRGTVEDEDLERLGDFRATPVDDGTELEGEILDQSHLTGVLTRLSRAGIEVVSAMPVRM